MIKANYNITSNSFGSQQIDTNTKAKSATTPITTPAINNQFQNQTQIPTGTRIPSRMGENNAQVSMLKSQILKSSSLGQISLKNGDEVTAYPANGNNNAPHTIYINGIEEWTGLATGQGQTLANFAGVPVDTIYQHSTIGDVAIRELGSLVAKSLTSGIFGVGKSLANLRAELIQKLQNPVAASKAADQIISQLGQPNSTSEARIIGYSQGAAITAEALKMVSGKLTQQYGADTASQMLGRVHILTIGGAAKRDEFPPQVELTQMYHKHDIVSQFFGDNPTSLIGDAFKGFGLLPHLSYMTTDKAALDVISQWQKGNIQNQDVSLKDVLAPF